MMQGILERNRITSLTKPDISNMQACVQDIKKAVLSNLQGPPDILDFHELRGRLQAAKDKLPKLYQDAVVNPFIKTLDELGQQGFMQILIRDPKRNSTARLMLDIAQSILQNAEAIMLLLLMHFRRL